MTRPRTNAEKLQALLDAIEENIAVANRLHAHLAEKLLVHDLREWLPFRDASFDFAYCDSVFQHLEPDDVNDTLLPEAARVLKARGILQLLFKCGRGIKTIHDPQYGEVRRFRLYDPRDVVLSLIELGMVLVEADSASEMGGVLRCTDPRQIDLCVLWARKE